LGDDKVNISKIKALIKERWKFYLVGYALGYAIPLIMDGAPTWKYFIPENYTDICKLLE